jgi:hypothetical protein
MRGPGRRSASDFQNRYGKEVAAASSGRRHCRQWDDYLRVRILAVKKKDDKGVFVKLAGGSFRLNLDAWYRIGRPAGRLVH